MSIVSTVMVFYAVKYRMLDTNLTEILIVEDNPGDVRLIKDAFEKTEQNTKIHTATDGYEALHFLNRAVADESKTLPQLALVGLNLPGKDGCEILETIRTDPHLEHLPVIILTSSDRDADIRRCYEYHANAYITKPTNPDEFVSVVESLEEFWCEHAELPPPSAR